MLVTLTLVMVSQGYVYVQTHQSAHVQYGRGFVYLKKKVLVRK